MKHLASKLKKTNWDSSEKEQHFNNNFAPLVVMYIATKKGNITITSGSN